MDMGTYNVMRLLVGWRRVLFQLYLIYLFLLKPVVHGRGRGHAPQHMPRVSWPLVACVNADEFSVLYFILLKQAVHGHGRGMHLGICLVNAACVVAFVACVNADKFSVMYLILLKSLMHGHGRCTRLGTCLVYTPCVVAFVACENADKFSVYVLQFIEVSCA